MVTNIHQLAERADRWLPQFEDEFFDLILVDEGHHNAAPSLIYRYPFRDAMQRGYIKDITAVNVAPRVEGEIGSGCSSGFRGQGCSA